MKIFSYLFVEKTGRNTKAYGSKKLPKSLCKKADFSAEETAVESQYGQLQDSKDESLAIESFLANLERERLSRKGN